MEKSYIGTRPFREIDPATASPTATATASPASGERMIVTDIAFSSSIAGSKARVLDGSTIIWEIEIPASGGSTATPWAMAVSFKTPLHGTLNTKVYLEVDGQIATPAAYACLVGFRSKN